MSAPISLAEYQRGAKVWLALGKATPGTHRAKSLAAAWHRWCDAHGLDIVHSIYLVHIGEEFRQ
jgi:lysylphosphatidylglycerol synthetase-like protein (DUF2156 family)